MLATMHRDPDSAWARFLDPAYVHVHRAHSLTVLADHHAATEQFRHALAALPRGYRRDEGVYLAHEALAYAADHHIEKSSQLGMQALAIGTETGSDRITRTLSQLDTTLSRWNSAASRQFRDAFAAGSPA